MKKILFPVFVAVLVMPILTYAQTDLPLQTQPSPWAWYISRASALVSFALLYLSIFFGVTIRIPILRKWFAPLYALNAHCWLSVQALIFALIHGIALMFDKTVEFSLADVFIPFASSYKPQLVTLGTIALYLMIILIVTSYVRKRMSQKLWRATHWLNIALYGIGIMHALYLGTDLQTGALRSVFIWANVLLVIIFIINIAVRIKTAIARRNVSKTCPVQPL